MAETPSGIRRDRINDEERRAAQIAFAMTVARGQRPQTHFDRTVPEEVIEGHKRNNVPPLGAARAIIRRFEQSPDNQSPN
jgi:hypothetical protein